MWYDVPMTPDERFDGKWEYRTPFTCWVWKRPSSQGYGRFRVGERKVQAHRYAWERANGPVPDGLVLDHFICDTPACVNPDHVRPVRQRENIFRGSSPVAFNLSKTHCPQGHEYSEENTTQRANGKRACRACHRRWWHERKK